MKKEHISVQLYSFRDFLKTREQLTDTLKKLHSAGYRTVQLTTALPPDLTLEDLLKILSDTGMTAISSHENSGLIFEKPEKIISKLKKLNISHTAYPWPHIVPSSREDAVKFAENLNALARMFKDNQITLSYHNHSSEFVKLDEKILLDIIYEHAPYLDAELDTFWVHKGGGNVADYLRRLAGRTEYLHIKDYGIVRTSDGKDVPCMMPVGSGNLNWHEIIPTAEASGAKYFIFFAKGNIIFIFAKDLS